MKDREKRTSFQKAPQDTQVWVCRLMVIAGCVTICSPLFKKQKIQEVLSKCFYCFPTLTLKHSLCMQANTVRFIHFLDEKSDFSFPPIRAAIYIILVKKKNKKKKAGNWILPLCISWRSLLSHYFPKLPLKTLFSLLPAHFSPLCSFLFFRKAWFLVPWIFHLSLPTAAGETPSYLVSNTAHQETSLEEKMCLV